MDIIQSLVRKAVKLLHWAALIFALDYDVSMKSNVMLIIITQHFFCLTNLS